jgi:hypothetical protein
LKRHRFFDPCGRAGLLAIREELAKEWQPQNGIERQLIDAMAQAQTMAFFWTGQLNALASNSAATVKQDLKEVGRWHSPRVTEDRTIEQAAAMVERFNRILLRTLRALRDLRRYSPTIFVQNAGQVNVGGKQVNVTAEGK